MTSRPHVVEEPLPDSLFAVDAAAIVVVSAGICLASDDLALMTWLVIAVLALRQLAWGWLRGWAHLPPELAFFAVCTVLGAFNDWNSVVRHRIYDYAVPAAFPELTTIPIWMLLFWGMILRFFVTFATWRRLDAGSQPRDRVRGPSGVSDRPVARVLLQLALVLATRQTIYRNFEDPILSWLPFLAAGVVWFLLFAPDRQELRLAAAVAIIGPLVEVLYIQVGHLHAYHLGWLGGVPLWIALWWVLAVLVWKDIGRRLELTLLGAAHHQGIGSTPNM